MRKEILNQYNFFASQNFFNITSQQKKVGQYILYNMLLFFVIYRNHSVLFF